MVTNMKQHRHKGRSLVEIFLNFRGELEAFARAGPPRGSSLQGVCRSAQILSLTTITIPFTFINTPAILVASQPEANLSQGESYLSNVFAVAIFAFLVSFTLLIALRFGIFLCPSLSCALTLFCCNILLHVQMQGVRVWSLFLLWSEQTNAV